MISSKGGIESAENSFALAVAVIRERIQSLPKEDQDDLYELLPDLLSGDQESLQAAQRAVSEILDQKVFSVASLDTPDSSCSELEKWTTFFSQRLKELRVKAGLTQQQLAEQAGIPQSHVSRLENCEHSPTAKTRGKLAKALKVEEKELDPSA